LDFEFTAESHTLLVESDLLKVKRVRLNAHGVQRSEDRDQRETTDDRRDSISNLREAFRVEIWVLEGNYPADHEERNRATDKYAEL
jgi:hypothetical protein